jgi:hypothetical protein
MSLANVIEILSSSQSLFLRSASLGGEVVSLTTQNPA